MFKNKKCESEFTLFKYFQSLSKLSDVTKIDTSESDALEEKLANSQVAPLTLFEKMQQGSNAMVQKKSLENRFANYLFVNSNDVSIELLKKVTLIDIIFF